MGIGDRDYMRRPLDDEPSGGESTEDRLGRVVGNILKRHRGLLVGVAVALAVLMVIGLALAFAG